MVLNYSIVEGYDSKIPDTTDIVNKIEQITNKLATHVLSETELVLEECEKPLYYFTNLLLIGYLIGSIVTDI